MAEPGLHEDGSRQLWQAPPHSPSRMPYLQGEMPYIPEKEDPARIFIFFGKLLDSISTLVYIRHRKSHLELLRRTYMAKSTMTTDKLVGLLDWYCNEHKGAKPEWNLGIK